MVAQTYDLSTWEVRKGEHPESVVYTVRSRSAWATQ